MNFQNMEYFLTVAEEQSFSGAARKLFVSQQALSGLIKKLEEEVGTPLFRRGNVLTLTPAGEQFQIGCKSVLAARGRMLADIADVSEKRRSSITVAASTYGVPPFLGTVIRSYREKYPEYEVKVVKRMHADVAHNMQGVDLYLSWLPLSEELDSIPVIKKERMVLCMSTELPEKVYGGQWPALRERLLESGNLALVAELPFLLLRDRNGNLAQDLWTVFTWYGFRPVSAFESEYMDLNAELCAAGTGALLCPETLAKWLFRGESAGKMLFCPVETPNLRCTLAFSYVHREHLNTAELCFIDEARRILAAD